MKSILQVRFGEIGCKRGCFSELGMRRFISLRRLKPNFIYTRFTRLWFQIKPEGLICLEYSLKPLVGILVAQYRSCSSTAISSRLV
jgi:hypothetical protein